MRTQNTGRRTPTSTASNNNNSSNSSNAKNDWKDREVGALWKKTSNAGQNFYSGKVKVNGVEIKIVGFANSDKKADNQPDVRLYIEKDK